MKVFLVYKTDPRHSYASRDVIGVATTLRNAIAIVKKQAAKEGEKLSRYTLEFLSVKLQTQDYSGEGEFDIEAVEKNTLL